MPKPSPKKPPDSLKIEFEPDAWERFESLVRSAAKMGPRPHDATPPQSKKAKAEKRTERKAKP